MASEEAAALRQAITALYGYGGGAGAANQWLNSFSKSPAAWSACLELVQPSEQPEVAFFAANMLLSKVRAEWHKLSGEQQSQMGATISTKFQLFASHAQAKLAMQRLGLLLAAVAALSGAAACQAFAGQCVSMIPGGGEGGQQHMSECALSMLTALAEEVHNMDKGRRQELVAATGSQWDAIASLAQGFIPEQVAAGHFGLVHGALLCLQAWLKLSGDASSSCRLSPGQLAARHPDLLRCLFALVGAPSAEAVTSERIETLAAELLCELLGPGTYGDDAAQERAAVDAAMAALLLLREPALAPGPAGASVARCVASVASALAARDVATVCGAGPGHARAPSANGNGLAAPNGHGPADAGGGSAHVLPLAELMLLCVSRPERCVCEAAVDYFISANTLPASERHAQMAAPLFGSLVGPLLGRHACYPPGFTSWFEAEEDEEAFHRFREQGLSELLESVYLMTGPPLLRQLQDAIASAQAWTQAEGALFALRAVAPPLKQQLLPSGGAGAAPHPHAAEARELLLALFEDVCSPGGRAASFLGNPYSCATAAGLVGAYAAWFEAEPSAPLEGGLRLLLHALGFPYSQAAAAAGFRALCMRCAGRLAAAQVVGGLAGVAAAAVAPVPQPGQMAAVVPMPLEGRQAVVEGLARIVTLLPPPEALDAALGLQQPHLSRTQAIISLGSGTAAAGGPAAKQLLSQLADELQLMAALIKGMEFPGPPAAAVPHPAMKLLEAAWPVLAAVAEAPVCQADRVVVEAVCEVHKRAVQTARGAAKPLLPTLLQSVGDLFAATQQAACLDMLATVTEVFGEVRNAPDVAAAQQQALEGAVTAAGAVLNSRGAAGQPLSASGDLLRALLAVGDAHLVFARQTVLGSAVLPAVFEWAMAASALREREPVNAALSFLSHLLAAAGKLFAAAAEPGPDAAAAAAAASQLRGVLSAHGEGLVRTLLLAACDTAPRQLLRSLAGVLYQLLQGSLTGEAGGAWLLAALQLPDLPGMSAGLLKPADCEAFAKLALRRPPLPRGRFDALLMDFAAIPRGECTSDALLAYEL